MMSVYYNLWFIYDFKCDIVWKSFWYFYFSKLIWFFDCVFDFGCGYGEFINNVIVCCWIGLDVWDGIEFYFELDVEVIVVNVIDFYVIEDGSVDFVFVSNLFEYISQVDFVQVLFILVCKLVLGGIFNIIQFNYCFVYCEYFDDYMYVVVYLYLSFVDFLVVNGYEILEV